MLNNYKVILWDFDGVILDSMPIRDLGFVKVLEREGCPNEIIEQLLVFHRKNGGLSRYVKFRYLYEVLLQKEVSEDEILRLANLFSVIMLQLLIDPRLLIVDAFSFIKQNFKNYKFHIVSGSDGKELKEICRCLDIDKYFITIEGSPTPKKELVSNLISKYHYSLSDVCLIGDSINDLEAANANGIKFLGYNNQDLIQRSEYIYQLTEA